MKVRILILLLAIAPLAARAEADSVTTSAIGDLGKTCGSSQLAKSIDLLDLPKAPETAEVASALGYDQRPTAAGVFDISSDLRILASMAKVRSHAIAGLNASASKFGAVCSSVQEKFAYQADGSKLGEAGFMLRADQELFDARHRAMLFLLQQASNNLAKPKYAKDRYTPACRAGLARVAATFKSQYESLTRNVAQQTNGCVTKNPITNPPAAKGSTITGH